MTQEDQKAKDDAIRAEAEGIRGTLKGINDSLGELKTAGKTSDDAINERIGKIEDSLRKKENVDVGLTKEETQKFSVSRAISGMQSDNWHGSEFEREAMDAAAKIRAAHSTVSVGVGGYLLPEEVSNRIIAPLKARAIVGAAGATIMEGLSGTVNMPKLSVAEMQAQTDGSTVSDQSANWAYTESSMTANYSGEVVKVSRSLLAQGVPSVDRYIEEQMLLAAMRKVDVVALAEIQALTTTADLIAKVASAGNALKPINLHRAWTVLQNANAIDPTRKLSFVANALVKWHVLNGANSSANAPWLPFATDAALGEAMGINVFATSVFNDDTGVNGEAVLGDFSGLIVGLFGEGIEIASSEHSSFLTNNIDFRVLLAADAVIPDTGKFVHWDNLGDA